MIKVITLVKRHPSLSPEAFFDIWVKHTREWDLKDHPEVTRNRLCLTRMADGNDGPYDGIAETHWPDKATLDRAAAWYGTPEGQPHLKDLQRFMDIENSPTMIISMEADVE